MARPIGIFDSGLGGISVFRAVHRLLPTEDYIYYGDSANAPYGTKSVEQIQHLALAVVEKLRAMRCKAIVIACNTATQAALVRVQTAHPDLPVIGTTPAVAKAVRLAPGGVIWVMATSATLASSRFGVILSAYDDKASLVRVPCPGLMEFVERGELRSEALRRYLANRFADLPAPDVIVLGCTHYPFLAPMIRAQVGAAPFIIDAAEDIALTLKSQLHDFNGRGGAITWINSLGGDAIIDRSKALFALELAGCN